MDTKQVSIENLTEKQKECLRLVQDNYSSKEIGRKLGVSQYAVDQRLRLATRLLNATSRFEAARTLTYLESSKSSNQTYHSMTYDTPHLLASQSLDTNEASSDNQDQSLDSNVSMLNEAQAPYGTYATLAKAPYSNPLIFAGREFQGTLSVPMQIVFVLAITTISLLAFAAAISGLEILSRI